jgi:hypothetical protein
MRKPAAAAGKRGDCEVMGPRQLKKADELLTRIERRGEALSESADRLLRRVSWPVAKTPIGDKLIRALETIDELYETVGKHDEILNKLADRLAEMERRLAAVEKAEKPWAAGIRPSGPRAWSLSALRISIE